MEKQTKEQRIETNTFKRQKIELDEIRKESFRQGIWKGIEQGRKEILKEVRKIIDEVIKEIPVDKNYMSYWAVGTIRDEIKQKIGELK